MQESYLGWIFLITFLSIAALGLIIFAIYLFVIANDYFYSSDRRNTRIFASLSAAVGIFCGLFGPIKGSSEIKAVYNKNYSYTKWNIISLDTDTGVEGRFVLGSGYLSSTRVYYFYTITNIGYKLESADYSYTYIVEDNHISPHIQHIKEAGSMSSYYVIYVPKDTIIKEYHA